jgi:outer membrane protein OmpA-like peptidoglycan-associated protein
MMIFLLVSVIFMVQVDASRHAMRSVAQQYNETRDDLYKDLLREFSPDLARWRATLDHDLTIRFQEPNVLFDTGKADLKAEFKGILGDFFPRYVKIIYSPKYRDSVQEVRIEGHTSSLWAAQRSTDEAYFRNMELSQSRTRSALEYLLMLSTVQTEKDWLIKKLTANGLSSSHTIQNPDGTENAEASQRVEFHLRTDAEARIGEILRVAP